MAELHLIEIKVTLVISNLFAYMLFCLVIDT